MKKLTDKVVIFIVSLALYIPIADNLYMIIPILITVTLSALLSYFDGLLITITVFVSYLLVSLFIPAFIFFLPLISYDVLMLKVKWIWVLVFLPLAINSSVLLFHSSWLVAAFIIITYLLKHRTITLQNLEKDYYKLRDDAMEISIQLERQNKELLEKQDYGINLATLTERNRIARDIHDNVGHLLSRSILQIGALFSINKEEKTKKSLREIKDTLSEAMDSIRNSVHNLHEASVDLKTELLKLIKNSHFCPIKFTYDVDTNLEKEIKYCFIAVTKEALSNIIKHSNATEASVVVREHPAFYQLIIQDNGTKGIYRSENGIGIKNITDRVNALGGNVHITADKGFRIFISIPGR